ncbi:MAG: acyl-ACP--UDP-N-acetylglucosamine O-acyltransferase [Aquificae bacterium]|nr:acyl-ACP--UDP-N-acetylglucosamine O-acyltransferase [Aquificota bacterium]
MAKIHPTAVVEGEVELADGVEVGPYSVLRGRIKVGKGTKIGARVSIYHDVEIGENCRIFDGCVIGGPPQHTRDEGREGRVVIGNDTVLREFVTVNRGTDFDKRVTKIGNGVFIMAYAHVAHDCEVGDGVIMANAATLGGHVVVERGAFLGGLSAVQQRCRVGAYAMVGGLSGVNKDVPPFTRAVGHHVELKGLNLVALKRAGFPPEEVRLLEKAYRRIFASNKRLIEAVREVLEEMGQSEAVRYFCDFILESLERGRPVAVDKSLKRLKRQR